MRSYRVRYYSYFLWLTAVLALIAICMEVYADFILFIGFGGTFHLFLKFVVPAVPYYIFCLLIILAAIKQKPIYLLLSPIFFITVMRNQGQYLYMLISHPDSITLLYTKVLAIISCSLVTLASVMFFIYIYKIYVDSK